MRRVLAVAASLCLALALVAPPVVAVTTASPALITGAAVSPAMPSDCGQECNKCGPTGTAWQGVDEQPDGDHSMFCDPGESCAGCASGPGLAAHVVPAEEIAGVLAAISPADIPALVEAYGDRLLIQAEKGFIAVIGSSCSLTALETFVVVPRAVIDALGETDVRTIEEYLAST